MIIPLKPLALIFGNEDRILPVSTLLQGEYGQKDVFASVPCRLNANGVVEVIQLSLTEDEQKKFDASCQSMNANYQKALEL